MGFSLCTPAATMYSGTLNITAIPPGAHLPADSRQRYCAIASGTANQSVSCLTNDWAGRDSSSANLASPGTYSGSALLLSFTTLPGVDRRKN